MPKLSKYGAVIRRLRMQKDLSQERLAEIAKVDAKTIIQIEGGKRNPTLKTLQKNASALKVNLKELLP